MVCEMNRRANFGGGVCAMNLRRTGSVERLKAQGCKYNMIVRGMRGGEPIVEVSQIDSVVRALNPYEEFGEFAKFAESPDLRFVISNSTEAGIIFDAADKLSDAPPSTFPAKLAQLLWRRFEFFKGDASKGLIALPCELLERNGDALRGCVLKYARLWNLGGEFERWLERSCAFCNTLVDRIVSGLPSAEDARKLGISDELAVVAEPYYLWAIEAPEFAARELPFKESGLNAVFVKDVAPFRARKVTLLNAPHTLMSAVAIQCGLATVLEAVSDDKVAEYLRRLMFGELVKTLDSPNGGLEDFAREVLERFKNPYLEHALKSIAMNSVGKCAVRAVPPAREYFTRFGHAPAATAFGLAANIKMAFETRAALPPALSHVAAEKDMLAYAAAILSSSDFFGGDRAGFAPVKTAVSGYLENIQNRGMPAALEDFLNERHS